MAVLGRVDDHDLVGAAKLQQELDVKMRAAELRWSVDPTILSLAGYHRKNAYMIKHWQEYSAGRFPKDPLLEEGRSRFFETLLINPIDYGALNGLGNILLFQASSMRRNFSWAARSIVQKKTAPIIGRPSRTWSSSGSD
jgi:hypothetical protein